VFLVVDGVHGFGCTDESAAELGADFFCAARTSGCGARAAPASSGGAPTTGGSSADDPDVRDLGLVRELDETASRPLRSPRSTFSPVVSSPTSTSTRWRRRSGSTSGSAAPASPHGSAR
jgi:hypothetical protein